MCMPECEKKNESHHLTGFPVVPLCAPIEQMNYVMCQSGAALEKEAFPASGICHEAGICDVKHAYIMPQWTEIS